MTERLAAGSALEAKSSSEEQARRVLCEQFGNHDSAGCTVGETSFRVTTEQVDGTWEVLGFAGDVFVHLFVPGTRDYIYPSTTWSLRREGDFAVHEEQASAFVCPNLPEEHCVSWHPSHDLVEQPEPEEFPPPLPTEFFCPDGQALRCVQQGYNTEIFIIDPVTGRTVSVGPLTRAEVPTVTAKPGSRTVTVSSGTCSVDVPF